MRWDLVQGIARLRELRACWADRHIAVRIAADNAIMWAERMFWAVSADPVRDAAELNARANEWGAG